MKTWNLGNTTVRNPERIKDGLRVFQERFEGNLFNRDSQDGFFSALLEAGVIKGNPDQEGSRDWSGRKWASVFNKLGLASRAAGQKLYLTNAGRALLDDASVDSDVYLRQMLKVQLPSPTEDELEEAAIHPFYLVLSTTVELENQNMGSLTKEEIALFLQSATRDNMAVGIVTQIKLYRSGRSALEGRVNKRRYFQTHLGAKVKQLYGEDRPQKRRTLIDYSDTTMRYSAVTGIFSTGRQTLVLKEDQLKLAKALVGAGAPRVLPDEEFLPIFHNPRLPTLPTDDASFLRDDITALTARIGQLAEETGSTPRAFMLLSSPTIAQLKQRREDLETELISQKEIEFYRMQSRPDQVDDIIGVFDSIANREIIGGSDYMPAWAEWGVWRVFLSINTIASPINKTRGFRIDTELFPIHHARGGAEDMRFEYPDAMIISAEVTLNVGERQYDAERVPVRTHVVRLIEQNPESHVIGVFVAPAIQATTAHDYLVAYHGGHFSSRLGRAIPLNIVPLTIEQLCQLLPGRKRGCTNAAELRAQLDILLTLRPAPGGDGAQWLDRIDSYFASSPSAWAGQGR